ncbi:MAG: diphosphomevalonate decarboxylase [Candidatus Micrarchaeota archaeon]|nr:diphosphomevalonate decarboxylase [Candidatus Micrarchaeota archaeon]
MEFQKFTATANSNIAIIKYWGKRDEELILPTNSSISFTMDEQFSTSTTVEFDSKLKRDELNLDGKVGNENELERVTKFLNIVRVRAKTKQFAKVVSKNTFPKGTGMASSASGFAALAAAASKAAGLSMQPRDLSLLARLGSGSATRSVFGGAVEWQAGTKKDGSDSYAVQLSPQDKWKDLRNVISIVDEKEKKVSSRVGMKETIKTSPLYSQRLKTVEERLNLVRKAIANTDFHSMAETIMRESNDMHAVMLDTFPPIFYMNDVSREIAYAVHQLNYECDAPVAAYTFDAGPNAHVYTTTKYVGEVKKLLAELKGIKEVKESKIGEGARFSEKHLF